MAALLTVAGLLVPVPWPVEKSCGAAPANETSITAIDTPEIELLAVTWKFVPPCTGLHMKACAQK